MLDVYEETIGYNPSIEFVESTEKIGSYDYIILDIWNEDVISYGFDIDSPYETIYFETWCDEDDCWEQHPFYLWDGEFRPHRLVDMNEIWRDPSLRAFGMTKKGDVPHHVPILRNL